MMTDRSVYIAIFLNSYCQIVLNPSRHSSLITSSPTSAMIDLRAIVRLEQLQFGSRVLIKYFPLYIRRVQDLTFFTGICLFVLAQNLLFWRKDL